MDYSTINSIVLDALSMLVKHDCYLIEADVSERSITHRLAVSLESLPILDGYHVDCEYNRIESIEERMSKKIKILVDEENMYILNLQERKLELGDISEFSTYPDIIIHKRGVNNGNLLVIEAKKNTNRINESFDDLKLKAYTGTLEEDKYRYEWGAFIRKRQIHPIMTMARFQRTFPAEVSRWSWPTARRCS
jgi:hypothetical protein